MTRVANRTPVTVLQHPRERRHPIGTARLLRLGLEKANVEVCWDLLPSAATQARLLGRRCGVLYPHPQAQDLATLPPDALPNELIVLDGTWPQARSLHRANTWLHDLPHYRIQPDGVDRYRIRREPQAHCTSTLEAVVQALQLLDPQTAHLDTLLGAFSAMIDRQVAFSGSNPVGRRRRARRAKASYAPAQWKARHERLVVAYCEFTLRRRAEGTRRELVYVTAHHPHSGRTLACTIKPPTLTPDPAHLQHMGLDPASWQAAVPIEEMQRRWNAFCPPGAEILAWNQVALDLLERDVQPEINGHLLKGVYCNVTQRRPCGHLEDVLAHHALEPIELTCPGRAAPRLGGAVRIMNWLCDEAVRRQDGAEAPQD